MDIFSTYTVNSDYYEFTKEDGSGKILMPFYSVILVNDNSGFISVKLAATRKTVGLVRQ